MSSILLTAILSLQTTEMYELIHGDCIDALRHMPDKSVEWIVTDPPYVMGAHRLRDAAARSLLYGAHFSPAGRPAGEASRAQQAAPLPHPPITALRRTSPAAGGDLASIYRLT